MPAPAAAATMTLSVCIYSKLGHNKHKISSYPRCKNVTYTGHSGLQENCYQTYEIRRCFIALRGITISIKTSDCASVCALVHDYYVLLPNLKLSHFNSVIVRASLEHF